MLLDSRTDHKEMETEELIDIVLICVNPAGELHSNDKTHYDLSVQFSFGQASVARSPCKDSSL